MTTGNRDDRGGTLVEAALVYALLFLALFAVVEFGLAFKDWLSVSHAAREGARAGATYGDDPTADIQILRDIEATLAPAGIAESIDVRIFDAEAPYTARGCVAQAWSVAEALRCWLKTATAADAMGDNATLVRASTTQQN